MESLNLMLARDTLPPLLRMCDFLPENAVTDRSQIADGINDVGAERYDRSDFDTSNFTRGILPVDFGDASCADGDYVAEGDDHVERRREGVCEEWSETVMRDSRVLSALLGELKCLTEENRSAARRTRSALTFVPPPRSRAAAASIAAQSRWHRYRDAGGRFGRSLRLRSSAS